MRNIHLDSPSPSVFVKTPLEACVCYTLFCFTECSSCWTVLIGIPWPTEKARGQGGDFLALLNSLLSTPPSHVYTRTLMLHLLLLFLQESCAHMVLHWLCSCSISVRASAHIFSTQFFNNSGLEEHLKDIPALAVTFSWFQKGPKSEITYPYSFGAVPQRQRSLCPTDGKI